MYVYIIRVRVEGFVVPDVVPKMAAMADELLRERIAVCKAMGGLGCGEVVPGRGRVVDEEVPQFQVALHIQKISRSCLA